MYFIYKERRLDNSPNVSIKFDKICVIVNK